MTRLDSESQVCDLQTWRSCFGLFSQMISDVTHVGSGLMYVCRPNHSPFKSPIPALMTGRVSAKLFSAAKSKGSVGEGQRVMCLGWSIANAARGRFGSSPFSMGDSQINLHFDGTASFIF